LDPVWIECDVSDGQPGWRIKLTGLASPAQPPTSLHSGSTEEPTPEWSASSAESSTDELCPDAAKPDDGSGSAPPEAPLKPPPNDSRQNDTRPDPTRPSAVEEKLGKVLGEKPGAASGLPRPEPPYSRNESEPL